MIWEEHLESIRLFDYYIKYFKSPTLYISGNSLPLNTIVGVLVI